MGQPHIDALGLISSFAFELSWEPGADRYWVTLTSNAKPEERHIVGYAEPVGEAWGAHYAEQHQPGRTPDELREDLLSATFYLSHRYLGAAMDSATATGWPGNGGQPPSAP